jgi:hypothetical protein
VEVEVASFWERIIGCNCWGEGEKCRSPGPFDGESGGEGESGCLKQQDMGEAV